MSDSFDLIIRGGTVYDGSGNSGIKADVAVSDGVIVQVGQVTGKAAKEIDATGKIVTPGFVDIHTHYDGQVTWSNRLSPSSNHGVTTVVMGNCGVGFAPCRADDHDMLIRLMEGVEDIPGVVLKEGLKWDWETLPEFLDNLDGKSYDMDFAAQVTHAPLRVYVMGERGANREAATADEILEMARLAKEGVEAGALGFSTSRTINHRTSDGKPTPTLTASQDELVGIAMGLKEAGKGVLQVVSDFKNAEGELELIQTMSRESGRPLSVSLVQNDKYPDTFRQILDGLDQAQAEGLQMKAQVCGRAVGIVMGLETSLNPLTITSTYRAMADDSLEAKVEKLKDPKIRQQLIKEVDESDHPAKRMIHKFAGTYILGDPPQYEQGPEQTLEAIAKENGVHPIEVAIDGMLENDGKGILYIAFLNYVTGDLEPALEMIKHPHTVMGLADGGAHVGLICDASFPTTMLTHWTRDRTRGDKLPLEFVIKCYTKDCADVVGLYDRGVLAPGYKADINVIDYENLTLHSPVMAFDLPAGGKRLNQLAEGYTATIVNGLVTYENGKATGELPGRLIRGAKESPANI